MVKMDLNTLFSLEGKVALITGGSRGVGKMFAQGFLQAGATVYISARKKFECLNAADMLSEFGPCVPFPGDISTAEGRENLYNAFLEREEKLDILVNNAGTNWGEDFDTYPDQAFENVLNLNVTTVFSLTRMFAPLLEKAGTPDDPARIINIGSMDGLHVPSVSRTGTFAYSASKAALHHLTRVLAVNLAQRNITTNAIAPGFFHSNMSKCVIMQYKEDIEANCPLNRLGKPEEMAGAAIYLSSRAGAYINGAVITVDGGTSVFHQHVKYQETPDPCCLT